MPTHQPTLEPCHPDEHAFSDCSDDEYRDGARLGCPRCQAVQRILSAGAPSSRLYETRFRQTDSGPVHAGNAYGTYAEAARAAEQLRMTGVARAWVQMPEREPTYAAEPDCPTCEDGGIVERCDRGGYYEAPCPECAEREHARHLEVA